MRQLKPINTGSLWLGEEWKDAIVKSLKHPDCGIEPIYKDKYPNNLLSFEKEIIGYRMYGYGNNRKYITRIPKSLNGFVESIIR